MATWNVSSGANAPYIVNQYPEVNETGVSVNSLIYFDIIDINSDIRQDTLYVYIKEQIAYDGSSDNFSASFNGSSSAISAITVGIYDGYHIVLDSTEDLSNVVTIRVICEDILGNSLDQKWAFIAGTKVNVLCFSDDYGLKAIDICDITGESQILVRSMLSFDTPLPLKESKLSYIHGEFIDGYQYLALSYNSDSYGTSIIKNMVERYNYYDGYSIKQAQINEDGTLYLINETDNEIDVFYGVDFRGDTGRVPDYIYDSSSTPSIISGDILCLHIVNDASLIYSQGTRLYVGTTLGMSRVDTYDKQTDGYSDGLENFGMEVSYGISGSGMTYESIGGTVSRVTAISSDEDNNVIFVATNDGAGNGGLTQINLVGNSKLVFLDEASGLIPSNNIRNIFGKAY